MPQRALDSRRSVESCTFQLHSWRPFQHPTTARTLDSDATNHKNNASKPYYPTVAASTHGTQSKRPCLSDRPTSFSIDAIDMSRLSLFDDDRSMSSHKRGSLSWIARKRRRRGSRSVSGRSSDRSGTRPRCCSVGASATCSDIPVAVGTDSSGELFVNEEGNWAFDVNEAAKDVRRGRDGGIAEREILSTGFGQGGNLDNLGNDSGYGSEPGYRGDAEFGYGDEVDEEDDPRVLFWGEEVGGTDSNMEMVGENTLQKAHYRCRRKKQDVRMIDPRR